jgi:GH25 family lysozyme M1 (1,4-beta-N-acetylmuramidase)
LFHVVSSVGLSIPSITFKQLSRLLVQRCPNQYLTGFENYPLWLAEYRQNETPQLPLNWKRWTFWQYSQNGRVAGINGSVDLNQFNGTAEQLRALLVK